ncbi:MAG: tetratricopeptide repeat protein [Pedosphaera sp.]|nr:tetratricopeptide repeat protein [Pedosphaera sp.]
MTRRLHVKSARGTESIAGRIGNPSQPTVQSPPGWVTVSICLLLAVAVWVVFGQTRHHEFINLDDDRFIYGNAIVAQGLTLKGVVSAFTHLNTDNWHPLTSLSYMMDCQFYGLNPGGHHLTNVLLHAATAILLFLVLRNLTGSFWRSAFVAAVFALHPLRVESVAWATERKDVLSGLFFVLTLGAYARYVRRSEKGGPKVEGNHWRSKLRPLTSRDYWLAVLLFALGLLSKTMLVTLPFVLLLLDYWPLRRLEFSTSKSQLSTVKQLVWEKLPFLLLSAVAGVATMQAQAALIESAQNLTLLARAGNALVSYAVYLGQMFYPVGLAVFYPHPGNQLSVWTVGLCAVVLGLVTVGVMRWQRTRPYLLVGWLWYLGMLVPVIGIVQAGSHARQDHYTYLPHIGLYVMVAWGAVELCGRWRWHRAALPAAAVVTLTGLMALAHAQTGYWRDSVALWTHTLACTSGNVLAHNNLGNALGQRARWSEAIPQYEQALQLKPGYVEAQNNLGLALFQLGRWDEAIPHFKSAIRLAPYGAAAYSNLGVALAQQGKLKEAIPYFERALQINPDYQDAHANLGVALDQLGRGNEAIPHFARALQLNPQDAQAENNLGLAFSKQEKWREAIPHFERAVQLNPGYGEARKNLGFALSQQGK